MAFDVIVLNMIEEAMEMIRPTQPFDLEPPLSLPATPSILQAERNRMLQQQYDDCRAWHRAMEAIKALR